MASILLVDDDELFRAVVCPALRAADHAVEEAVDGAQALRLLKAETPDILITDIFMPNRDGIELIAAVRQAHPAVRIMAISARQNLGMVDLLNLAERLGAHATLAKPFTTEQLLEKLAELERVELGRA
jgi:CheY-like chemotaxis protein